MNEIIAQIAKQHKLSTDGLGLSSLDEENERLHYEKPLATFRVPVTITRQGFMTLLARDAESATNVVNATAAITDDIEDVVQTELIGRAEKM